MDGARPRPAVESSRPGRVLLAGSIGAVVFAAVFFGGASGDADVVWVGGAAVVLAALAFGAVGLGLLPAPALSGSGRVAVAAFIALVAWSGVSIAWSVAGDRSWSALNKGIAYVCFLALGLALAALGTRTTRTAASLLAIILGAALAWSLAGKAIPALAAHDASRVARLHSPVGYWNGLALLADAALALGLWLAVAASERRPVKGLGAALSCAAVLATLLTTSRAGVLGALLAAGLWLWLGPCRQRAEGAAVLAVAAVPAAAVAAWAFTRPALVDAGQPHHARVHDGALFGVLTVAAVALAVALALAAVPRLVPGRERLVGRTLAAGSALAVVVGLVAVALASGNPFAKAANGFSRSECPNTASRLACTNNNRLKWWREAADVFWARPAGGAGADTFEIARKRYRRSGATVTEPHSVPLQVLAGTGVLGGLLVLAFAGAGAVGLQGALRRLDGAERTAAAALVALPAAYALHALVDYDIDFLALTAPALVAVGALLAAGRPAFRPVAGLLTSLAVSAVAATAVVSLALPWLSARRVDASYAATEDARYAQGAADARSARSLDPLSLDPLEALAFAYQAAGDVASARVVWTRATRLQPENPDTWYALGLFESIWTKDLCAAYGALNHAYTLDPNSTHWTNGGVLDVARDAVNHGACEGPRPVVAGSA
jgi:tetratricopeptide (TPR) repeat protein